MTGDRCFVWLAKCQGAHYFTSRMRVLLLHEPTALKPALPAISGIPLQGNVPAQQMRPCNVNPLFQHFPLPLRTARTLRFSAPTSDTRLPQPAFPCQALHVPPSLAASRRRLPLSYDAGTSPSWSLTFMLHSAAWPIFQPTAQPLCGALSYPQHALDTHVCTKQGTTAPSSVHRQRHATLIQEGHDTSAVFLNARNFRQPPALLLC